MAGAVARGARVLVMPEFRGRLTDRLAAGRLATVVESRWSWRGRLLLLDADGMGPTRVLARHVAVEVVCEVCLAGCACTARSVGCGHFICWGGAPRPGSVPCPGVPFARARSAAARSLRADKLRRERCARREQEAGQLGR